MSALPTPRFAIGDVVFHASAYSSGVGYPCPDCEGSGEWKAVSPKGVEVKIRCPRCDGRKQLVQHGYASTIARLTIGQVRIEWPQTAFDRDRSPIQYMCVETGVGGGTLYPEADMYTTEEEAQAAAKAKADKQNADLDERQPERARQREIYSYEIEAALKAKSDDARREAEYQWQRLRERVLELDAHPIAHEVDEHGSESDGYIYGSLTEEQVILVQNSLLRGDEDGLRLLAQYRSEAA